MVMSEASLAVSVAGNLEAPSFPSGDLESQAINLRKESKCDRRFSCLLVKSRRRGAERDHLLHRIPHDTLEPGVVSQLTRDGLDTARDGAPDPEDAALFDGIVKVLDIGRQRKMSRQDSGVKTRLGAGGYSPWTRASSLCPETRYRCRRGFPTSLGCRHQPRSPACHRSTFRPGTDRRRCLRTCGRGSAAVRARRGTARCPGRAWAA